MVPAVLLRVGSIKIGDIVPSAKNCLQMGFSIVGVGEFRIKDAAGNARVFMPGSKLVVKREGVAVCEPGFTDSWYRLPAGSACLLPGEYDLGGQERYFKVLNTTLQAQIGRTVRYFTAATMTEPFTWHRWTYTGGSGSPQDKPCTYVTDAAGAPPLMYYGVWSSSLTNSTGGAITLTEVDSLNASLVKYAEITGLSVNIPDTDTCDFTWTENWYRNATSSSSSDVNTARYAYAFFTAAANTTPVNYVTLLNSGVEVFGPVIVSYDPTTGKSDYSSTYTDWYANDCVNSGSSFNYDAIRVYNTMGTALMDIAITPGTWAAGAKKDIKFTILWSDKP